MSNERILKTLTIYAHSRDCNDFIVTDAEGSEFDLTAQTNNYVPRGLGVGGGDAVQLTIDIETGRVLNWDAEKVKAAILDITKSWKEEE